MRALACLRHGSSPCPWRSPDTPRSVRCFLASLVFFFQFFIDIDRRRQPILAASHRPVHRHCTPDLRAAALGPVPIRGLDRAITVVTLVRALAPAVLHSTLDASPP